MMRARWSDNDRYFGPFTWSYSTSYPHWAVVLKSRGDRDGDDTGTCTLRISMKNATLIVALPNIIRPWREKVYPNWDAQTVERLGRNWYWNIDPRKYGFSLSGSHLSVYYGRTGGPSGDSDVQQQWGWFLPWKGHRNVRRSLYGLNGEHVWTEPRGRLFDIWDQVKKAEEDCPHVEFAFADYDGERQIAKTRIEELEWHHGEGWFKWLAWFRKPKIERTLNIEFSGETGKEKGSWKGGTVGTSIKMLPGELHEAAFRRYCDQEHRSKSGYYKISFIGAAAPEAPR